MEIFGILFNQANILPTVVMMIVVLYWSLMIVGLVGMETLDFDVDLDADAGIDMDLDTDLEVNADVNAVGGADHGQMIDAGGAEIDTSGGSTTGGNSPLKPLFEFLYLSDVPIVIVASAFTFGYWISSIGFNTFFNESNSFGVSLLWIIPNIIVALLITRVVVIPAAAIGRKTGPDDHSRQNMIGIVGVVTSSRVTERFGQLEVRRNNEPEISLNVRVAPGQQLTKGDAAKIVSYNNQDGTFLVEITKWENNSDD